jgi:hypothetical protein
MKPIKPEWHNEDQIEANIRSWLKLHGWEVQSRDVQSGADISAIDRHDARWIFEVKGYPATYKKLDGALKSERSKAAQRRIWFIEGLGQIVSRIKDPDLRIGLVFPDHPTDKYFENGALALPQFLRDKLHLWVILIDQAGTIRILSSANRQFEESAHAVFPAAR